MAPGILAFLDDELLDQDQQPVARDSLLATTQLTIIFSYTYSKHPYTRKIRQLLKELCRDHPDIICVTLLRQSNNDHFNFIRETGFYTTRTNYQILHTVLGITQLPSIAVLNPKGRKISSASHEECTLEWNNHKTTVERWRQDRSGLDCTQQIGIHMIYPSCDIL